MSNFYRNHKKGFIGTIIFHIVVLIFLLVFGFFTPLPLPGDQGILVNLGKEEKGFGNEKPASQKSQQVEKEKKEPAKKEIKPETPVVKQQAIQKKSTEDLLTQDYEKTIALENAKKKEEEKKRQEEIERKKKEEEASKKAEAEKKKKEEEQRKIAHINQLANNAFGNSSKGENNSKGSGKGIDFPEGTQGNINGDKDSKDYSQGPGGDKGISFSLSGRNALALPKPQYPGNDEGVVVVQVTVDKNGNVTKAEPGFKGSNTITPELLNAAKKAALTAKFNADENAAAFQQGTITYRFILE